jgi:type IV pilus modification protein PilV
MTTENRNKQDIIYDKRGFTLIEVMVAIAIFAVGILALAGLQSNYISGNAQARLQTEGTALGAHVIEQLRSLTFDAPELDEATNPHQPPAGSTGPYDVSWTVTENDPVNNAKRVRVVVTPTNRNGRPVRLSTIIAE